MVESGIISQRLEYCFFRVQLMNLVLEEGFTLSINNLLVSNYRLVILRNGCLVTLFIYTIDFECLLWRHWLFLHLLQSYLYILP